MPAERTLPSRQNAVGPAKRRGTENSTQFWCWIKVGCKWICAGRTRVASAGHGTLLFGRPSRTASAVEFAAWYCAAVAATHATSTISADHCQRDLAAVTSLFVPK